MEYTRLGNSDLEVSRIGFGCCPMGLHGWGKVDKAELKRAVRTALDLGVNLFDTADIYGLGTSEKILGESLEGVREKAVIATKFGVRRTPDGCTYYDNTPEWLETALEASLARLRTDYIDLYQIHYWDGIIPLDDTIAQLQRYRDQGKIRYFGVTNIDLEEQMRNEVKVDGLASFSFEFSLTRRCHEETIKRLYWKYRKGFLSWGSLGQGVLTGKYHQNSVFEANDRRNRDEYVNFHGTGLKRSLEILEKLTEISRSYP